MLSKKDVMITIETFSYGLNVPLFPADEDVDEVDEIDEIDEEMLAASESAAAELDEDDEDAPQNAQMMMEGRLVLTSRRAELVYHESELTGMEGSVTKIGFDLDCPELVSMLRGGAVNTALIFEEGRRHICVYNTPFSSFEVCIHTLKVENNILTSGKLYLDYLIEIHGARTERCKMTLTFRE